MFSTGFDLVQQKEKSQLFELGHAILKYDPRGPKVFEERMDTDSQYSYSSERL